MLDTAISNTTALEYRYYYYYSDLKVEDIEVKLDKYLPKVTQLLGGDLQFELYLPDFKSCIFSHYYSVSFFSFSFRSYGRCCMLVMRICMINVLPLLVSPFEMINIPIGFSPLNFCILDFCSFNVTATESFWDNLRHTEYV